MSAKISNDDDELEDQQYYDVGDGFLQLELAPYLFFPHRKVPVVFIAGLPEPFERKKLVPAALVERAKHDKEFEMALCFAIGLSYKQEMMETQQSPLVCKQCGKPAVDILLTPCSLLHGDPPAIMDMLPAPICHNLDCINQAKNNYLSFMEDMGNVLHECAPDQFTAKPMSRCCLNCGAFAEENHLLRCSRCNKAYYCNKECQRQHWKKHKQTCQAT